MGRGRADIAGSEDGEGPGPQEGGRPGEAAQDKGTLPLQAETILPSPWSYPREAHWGFWPTELQDHGLVFLLKHCCGNLLFQ